MTLDEALGQLRRLNEPVPRPRTLPTESEVSEEERRAGLPFHPDLRRYLLEASDVVYGTIEPVNICAGHTAFGVVLHAARDWGVPDGLVPVCENNADFYCITATGEIVFWSHNGVTGEKWSSLATWIAEVWIGSN